MDQLLPPGRNQTVRPAELELDFAAVDADSTVSGTPEDAAVELGTMAGAEVGVWELHGGTVTDTEADEFFVVTSGEATIEILDGPNAGETLTVTAGDVCRLVAGTVTRWTVPDHIRKVYVMDTGADEDDD